MIYSYFIIIWLPFPIGSAYHFRQSGGLDDFIRNTFLMPEDNFADISGGLCGTPRKVQADDFFPILSLQNQERSRIKSLMDSTRNFFPSSDSAEKLWSESSKE